MKNGKCPTRAQRKRLVLLKMNPDAWLISKDCPSCLEIVHRVTGKTRKLELGREKE